ncbi:TetR/AcrR family transcriptional regulator [Geodermatophilus sp. TF02-6]|uniref:TetR/AcrR family transcriptional regulator n=1 Tax=Geodermatophilus sp. TF02-6 TaxID=2250575 RepID=UPI000DEAE48E|nr:TetR/AcrR family transcriptional regulator [Geodermatophilus sp. TF02-6]RBY81752.1 TetR/AcrR family transcriptional regulator [Geodermatophilus sp. TF02-6]
MAQPVPTGTSVRAEDLTAKARIRNAALDLFAERGEEATSLRAIASAAGVTVGLVVHHYGTKEALREAVELAVVERFSDAIASAPPEGTASEVVAARDRAVAEMLESSPAVVDYLRRAILDGRGQRRDLVTKLSELTANQVRDLRRAGLASTKHSLGEQVVTTMVRQLGRLFLQPLVDRIADEFDESLDGARRPQLVVGVRR